MSRDLFAGIVHGLGQSLQANLQRQENEELKKLQVKMFKQQLEQKEKAQHALDQLMQLMGPSMMNVPPHDDEPGGNVNLPGKSLMDILADPRGQALAMQSGAVSPQDLIGMQRPMPALARPRFKTEVPSSDGMSMIQLDEFGQEMGRRPMGPGERKEDPKSKAQLAVTNAKQRADRVSKLIDNAVERVGVFTTGAVGMPLSMLPGTPARNLRADIDTIKANIGFDELNAMRQASPTGGALGQVSERELGFLQSVLANLEQSQSPEQLKRNLLKAKEEIRQSWERVMEAYEQDFGKLPGEKNKPSLKGPGKQNKVVDFNDLP